MNLLAQNPSPYFIQYTTEDGLPSPEVYCVFQDSKGYMWFGTDNGVCRFDGYAFEVFDYTDGLQENVVFRIFEDDNSIIWFSTQSGKMFFYDEDCIIPYKFNDVLDTMSEHYSYAYSGGFDENNSAWFMLQNHALIKIDEEGNLSAIKPTLNSIYFKDDLYCLIYASSLNIKEGEYGLVHIEDVSNSFKMDFKIKFPSKSEQLINLHYLGKSGHYLLGFYQDLYLVTPDQVKRISPPITPVNKYVTNKDGTISICLGKDQGVRIYDSVESMFKNNYIVYLDGYSVSDYYLDRQGGLWLSTLEDGVFYAPKPFDGIYNSAIGWPGDRVTAIEFYNSDSVFIGFESGEVVSYNFDKKILSDLRKPSNNASTTAIKDIKYHSSTQTLWVGNFYFYKNWKTIKSRIAQRYSYSQMLDNTNDYLWSSNSSGVNVIDVNRKKYLWNSMDYKLPKNPMYVTAIHPPTGKILIGARDGIYEYDLYDCSYNKRLDLLADNIRVEDIEIKDSMIIIATKGSGLHIINGSDRIQIETDDGLVSNMIEDIHLDIRNRIWVASFNGLSVIKYNVDRPTKIETFTNQNGLPSNEIFQINSYDSTVYICSGKGLFIWNELRTSDSLNERIITKGTINGIEKAFFEESLKHSQNNITFNVLALDYKQQGQINYRFRLNANQSWTENPNRLISFSNLSPGKYNFEVQAQSGSGNWSESTTYPFRIKPPWWNSWIARIMYFLSFGSIAFFIYKNRIKRITEKNTIALEIQELQRMATQAQMNPHFIFNCLNSIQSFINQDEKEKANAYLVLFSRLVRASLNASMKKVHSLEDEVALLTDYIELEKMRFKSAFEYDIKVDQSIETYDTFLPPMLIQPIVENAIKHGLLPSNSAENSLSVSFEESDQRLMVSVKDNGVGFKATSKKIKSNSNSIGISNTQKRLRLHNNNDVDNLHIYQLQSSDGISEGTEVVMYIKLMDTNLF